MARKVQGYEIDSSRPGLKTDREYDLDAPGVNESTTGSNVGAVPAASATAGVTVAEYGNGTVHRTVFTLTAVSVTMTDATTAGCHGAVQLYDFPAGVVTFLGGSTDLAITAGAGGIADGAAVVGAVGTATAGTDNATLTTTEADLIPSTAATLTAGVGACDGQSTTALLVTFDGTATAKDAFLNFAVPDADSSANDTLEVTGTVTLVWIYAGDN